MEKKVVAFGIQREIDRRRRRRLEAAAGIEQQPPRSGEPNKTARAWNRIRIGAVTVWGTKKLRGQE